MDERTTRTALLAGAIALGLLSIGAGAVIGLAGGDADAAASSPTAAPSPTASPQPSEEPTAEPSASPTPARPALPDGTHFVYVTAAERRDDGSAGVTVDLAYFLTGEEGERAAADHGDEFVNDYYIVNDNPRLRTLPVAADADVRYLPAGAASTELQPGSLDAWLGGILRSNPTDYGGSDVPWWFTVRDGVVTRIEQQYLP
jgi:hypothetical protein